MIVKLQGHNTGQRQSVHGGAIVVLVKKIARGRIIKIMIIALGNQRFYHIVV